MWNFEIIFVQVDIFVILEWINISYDPSFQILKQYKFLMIGKSFSNSYKNNVNCYGYDKREKSFLKYNFFKVEFFLGGWV